MYRHILSAVKKGADSEMRVFTVDAFTSQQFAGNPAAVCLSPYGQNLPDELMQKIAREFNHPETAFVQLLTAEDTFETASCFGLRWLTPTNEVPLCGHATLASAAVIFTALENRSEKLSFKTLSGILGAEREGQQIILTFPLNPSVPQEREDIQQLLKLVADDAIIDDVEYSPNTKKLVVRLKDTVSRQQLEAIQPIIDQMCQAEPSGRIRGVIITVKGQPGSDYDFLSRFFSPWNGIPEDPVTGSAHTVLASYWSKVLGKLDMTARQCSARGGDLKVCVRGDQVQLIGQAVIVVSGNLHL